MSSVKRRRRPYDAPRRRQQAESTRAAIVGAARRLFAQHGYAATTLERVAHAAGVSVQTVYASFGSKRGILAAMIDAMDDAADVAGRVEEIRATVDPREQLRRAVALAARVFRAGYDVIDIMRGAGTADPDLAHVWREAEARRRPGQAELVRHWATSGALRTGVSAREAADVLWAMTGPDVYRLFVIENRWALNRYQRWLTALLTELLLASPTPPRLRHHRRNP